MPFGMRPAATGYELDSAVRSALLVAFGRSALDGLLTLSCWDRNRAAHPLANGRKRSASGHAPVVPRTRARRAVPPATVVGDHMSGSILSYVVLWVGTEVIDDGGHNAN